MFKDTLDLTWLVDMIAAFLKAEGGLAALFGALLLFAVQAFGGAKINVSGWIAGFFSRPTVHDLLQAELHKILAETFKAKTQVQPPVVAGTVVPPPDPHDEFRKLVERLKG